MNKVILIGRLGADPEVRDTANGKRIVTINLATSENWKDKDGNKQEKTEWHRVVIFNDGISRVAGNYLKKGSQCMVEGKLQTRKWQDKDGNDKFSTEVVIGAFGGGLELLGGKPDGTSPPNNSDPKPRNAPVTTTSEDMDDEIPF